MTILLAFASVAFIANANQILYLRNDYDKPLIVKVNGQILPQEVPEEEKIKIIDIPSLKALEVKTANMPQYMNLKSKVTQLKKELPSHKDRNALLMIRGMYDEENLSQEESKLSWLRWEPNPTSSLTTEEQMFNAYQKGTLNGYDLLGHLVKDYSYPYGEDYAKKLQNLNDINFHHNGNLNKQTLEQMIAKIDNLRSQSHDYQTFKTAVQKIIDET